MQSDPLPRYVILRHAAMAADPRGLHWDFMLEMAGSLRTWALAAEPVAAASIGARPLAEHRLAYLDYEGPISRNRGEVSRWDAGHFLLEREQPGELVVHLRGNRLRGRVTLTQQQSEDHLWRFSFVADPSSA